MGHTRATCQANEDSATGTHGPWPAIHQDRYSRSPPTGGTTDLSSWGCRKAWLGAPRPLTLVSASTGPAARAHTGHIATQSSQRQRELPRSQPHVRPRGPAIGQGHEDPCTRPGLQADSSAASHVVIERGRLTCHFVRHRWSSWVIAGRRLTARPRPETAWKRPRPGVIGRAFTVGSWQCPAMRTPGGEVICGRWGRSLSGGSLSESFSVDGVAVLVCCTASGPVGGASDFRA